jgi:hypothetical protein
VATGLEPENVSFQTNIKRKNRNPMPENNSQDVFLKNLREVTEKLGPLETFDKNAFIGDENFPQDLCNLFLSLALIWNDSKNLNLYYEFIETSKPEDVYDKPEEKPKTPAWGEISGHRVYIEKMQNALIHELFKLVKESQKILLSPAFTQILSQTNPHYRESWKTIVDFANGKHEGKSPFGKALLLVRHKIANHYDPNEIFKGYKRKFIDNKNEPFISRGDSMEKQRFFFADAAAQEYYRSCQEKLPQEGFYLHFNLIRHNLNAAMKGIVETFIQRRSAWKSVASK